MQREVARIDEITGVSVAYKHCHRTWIASQGQPVKNTKAALIVREMFRSSGEVASSWAAAIADVVAVVWQQTLTEIAGQQQERSHEALPFRGELAR